MLIAVAVVVAGLCSVPRQANAATVTLTGIGLGTSSVPILAVEHEYAGQIVINVNRTTFVAFCSDLFTPISLTTYNGAFGAPGDYPNGKRVVWQDENYGTAATSNNEGAALQIALSEPAAVRALAGT